MKAIVIFWILISLSFLEATLLGSGPLTSEQKAIIMDSIRTGNVDKFEALIKKDSISPDFDRGLFLNEACENGQESIVNYLLRSTDLLLPYADNCLLFASTKGRTEVVRLLLTYERVNPAAGDNLAIRLASQNGHTEVVRLLLTDERVNPAANNENAIKAASHNGHTEVVRLLLNSRKVNPAAEDDEAIKVASHNGHTDVVRLLLNSGKVDPAAEDDKAIELASKNGHTEVVRLLLNSGKVDT